MCLPRFLHNVEIENRQTLEEHLQNWLTLQDFLAHMPLQDAVATVKQLMVVEIQNRNRMGIVLRLHSRLTSLRRKSERAQIEFPEASMSMDLADLPDIPDSMVVRNDAEITRVREWAKQQELDPNSKEDFFVAEGVAYFIDWLIGDEEAAPDEC